MKAEYRLELIINCMCLYEGKTILRHFWSTLAISAVVDQKCLKIVFFIPGYPIQFGCHGYKENETF